MEKKLTRGAGGVAVTAGAKGLNVETEGVGRAAAGAVFAGAESGAGCGWCLPALAELKAEAACGSPLTLPPAGRTIVAGIVGCRG